jgi:hypothetical protein
VAFDELVAEMVVADFKTVAGERSRVLTHQIDARQALASAI